MSKYSLFIGRWQPWHDGHTALFERCVEKTGQVAIQIRDVHGIDDNPFDLESCMANIQRALNTAGYEYNTHYIIMHVPNIVDISYGRGVGYSLTQHDLGAKIHDISATKIRSDMREHGKLT